MGGFAKDSRFKYRKEISVSYLSTSQLIMCSAIKKKKPFSIYFYLGAVGILAVLIGFFTTYVTPNLSGKFKAPPVVHIHGFFAFGWIILFVIQSVAIKNRNLSLHKKLGYLSLFIALGIIATLLPVGLFQVNRDLKNGLGEIAISEIVGVVTTGLMFATLVTLGFINRKKSKVHKRLMLLATIVVLWPAWFRFRHYFPAVQRPDIWFAVVLADSLILVAWIGDKINHGKIHQVLLYGGLLIIMENVAEILLFDTATWRHVAHSIYNFLS